MAQPLSDAESSGSRHLDRRGASALDRLVLAAARGRGDAVRVGLLLETVAHLAERPPTEAPLPAGERAVWAEVGATFDGAPGHEHENDRDLIAAFAGLLERSVVGDGPMAALLGVDRSRISQRLADRSLYAYAAGDERCFPRWQLAGAKPLRGLRPVVAALDPGLHPLSVDRWFTTPNVDLEVEGAPVAPVTWLATGGDPETAARLAAHR